MSSEEGKEKSKLDERIIKRLADDPTDRKAWSDLLARHHQWLFLLLYDLTNRNTQLAEDLVQETFLRLVRYSPFSRLKPAKFRGYLRNIARNLFFAQLRKSIREQESHEVIARMMVRGIQDGTSEQFDEDIRDLFGDVSNLDRELLKMSVQGFSLKEMSQESGETYSNVAVRLHRLRKKLEE